MQIWACCCCWAFWMAAASGLVVGVIGTVAELTIVVVVVDVVDGTGGAACPGQLTLTLTIFHVPSNAWAACMDERPDTRVADDEVDDAVCHPVLGNPCRSLFVLTKRLVASSGVGAPPSPLPIGSMASELAVQDVVAVLLLLSLAELDDVQPLTITAATTRTTTPASFRTAEASHIRTLPQVLAGLSSSLRL